jgi:hypothetical protein
MFTSCRAWVVSQQPLRHKELAFEMFIRNLCSQDVADQLLQKTGGSPLMIRLLAGLLLEKDFQGRGPNDVDKWRSIMKDLETPFRNNQDVHVYGYGSPLLAYELSVQRMRQPERQLLAVLRHFPPVQEVPFAVVKAVWQGVWTLEDSRDFQASLQRLQQMNVVDIHQREHYGWKYGVYLNLNPLLVKSFNALQEVSPEFREVSCPR